MADEDSVAAAMKVMDRFLDALNRRDEAGVNAAFNFPHVRIASGKVTVFERRGDYGLDTFMARTDPGWAKSVWEEREVIHAGEDKVHLAVRFARLNAEGKTLGSYRSIYIVTRVDGSWGIQARSSFAA